MQEIRIAHWIPSRQSIEIFVSSQSCNPIENAAKQGDQASLNICLTWSICLAVIKISSFLLEALSMRASAWKKLIIIIVSKKKSNPTVRKNCSSDWEKLLKFKAEGREFVKNLWKVWTICGNRIQIEKIIDSKKCAKICFGYI